MPLIQNRMVRRAMWCAAAVVVVIAILYPTMPSRETVTRLTAEIKARQIHRLIEDFAQENGHYPEGLSHVDGADVTWRVAVSRFASRSDISTREPGDNRDEKLPPVDFILSRSSHQTPFYFIRAGDGKPDSPAHYLTDENGHPVIAAIPSHLSEWTSAPDITVIEMLERSQRGERVYLSYADGQFFQINAKKLSLH